jgi:hypothetical protein
MHATIVRFLTGLMLLASAEIVHGAAPISWSRQQLIRIMPPGFTTTESITFTSKVSVSNVQVVVVPALQRFIQVTPSYFSSITAGSHYELLLNMHVPRDTPFGTIVDGAVRLRTGSSTLAIPLNLVIQVDSIADAQNLASSFGGTVVGFINEINVYQILTQTTSVAELNSLIQMLTTNGSVLLVGVSNNFVMALHRA